MKISLGSVPGRQRPAGYIPVAHAKPKCAFGIFPNLIELIARKTVAAGIKVKQVELIYRGNLVGSTEVIEADTRQHPPLTLTILKNGVGGPQRTRGGRHRQAKTAERMTVECAH